MMKRTLVLTLGVLALSGCAIFNDNDNYERPMFYERFLNTSNGIDQQIQRTLEGLRANPDDPALHNELGMLLAQRGFPKDAEREFERALDEDGDFYPAWYNLALMRAGRGDNSGARRAFQQTIKNKPGHSAALFQLGLIEERRHNMDAAIGYYAKAFTINRSLLDVQVNPRILDSKLVHLAMLRAYPTEHTKHSLIFQPTPSGYVSPSRQEPPQAPSPQAPPQNIVPPTAPITDPASQQVPPPATNT